jgi:hypothetical protein
MTCPYCQSSLTVRLGNETHCNSCGKSFGLDRSPVSTQAANRKRAASASTGFNRHQHENEGLEAIEAEYNAVEAELREASRAVLSCRGTAMELSALRQVETLARRKRDELLAIRGELIAQRTKK